MAKTSFVLRQQQAAPSRTWENEEFTRAGFGGHAEQRSQVAIEELALAGSVDVFWRRSSRCLVAVAGESREACANIVTRFRGRHLTIEGATSGVVIVTMNGGVRIAGGDVWENGRKVSSGTHPGRAAVFIAQPTAPMVRVRGSGNVILQDVLQSTLRVLVQGSGDIEADGEVEHLIAEVEGSGDVDAGELTAQTVECTVAGSGDLDVHAVQAIKARVAGSGDIVIRGDPAARDTNVIGSGSVRYKRAR